ncbi:hypothetical protein [Bacillus cereus]|uniref:hypothetical protein n=1 Tax=Bacillus cereus TaxID=1396 RepID=UPI00159645A2|nr:hypothetical protein [Bacillus cereus]
MIRIAIGMIEFNMMIPVGVYSNRDGIDLHVGELTDKEKVEFENMVKDYKPIDKRIYQ